MDTNTCARKKSRFALRANTQTAIRILLLLTIVTGLLASIQKSEANTSVEPYSVLVVAGQSNAQGDESYAGYMDPPLGSHPADSATKIMWSLGDDQVNVDRLNSSDTQLMSLTDIQPFGYFGPEIGLARKLWDQGRRNMVILKVTYGLQRLAQTNDSTFGGLADWNVHSVNESYDALKTQYSKLKTLMQTNNDKFTVDGFYWMQGESDAAKGESIANYQTNLTELIAAARTDLEMQPEAKVVVSKISLQHCLTNEYNFINNPNGCQVNACFIAQHPCTDVATVTAGNANVRQAQQNVADSDPNVYAVDSADLARNNFDFMHMLWQSQLTMGARIANSDFELPYRKEGSDDYDGDGISNIDEDANHDGNLGNDDSDNDGVPDYLDEIVGIGGGMTSSVDSSKTVTDSVSGSNTVTSSNSILNWKYTVNNDTNTAASIEVSDHFSLRQNYVSDSLITPPNYIKSYSTDNGASFSTVQPLGNVTNIKATKTDVPISAKGDSKQVLERSAIYANSTTENEGYLPILVGERIFTLFHNTSAGLGPSANRYDIGCVEKIAGGNCIGYPKDFLDASNNNDFLAPWTPASYLEESTGRIYTSTQRNTGFGIACFDTTIDAMCAGKEYTQLNASGSPLGANRKSRVQQVNKIGSCLYTYDFALNVYSYDIATGATPCGTQTTKNLVSAYSNAFSGYSLTDHSDAGTPSPITQSQVIGTKMFIVMNYNYEANFDWTSCGTFSDACRGTRMICFDSATLDGKCADGAGGYFSNTMIGNCYTDRICKFTQPFENKSNHAICSFGFQEPNFDVYGIVCLNTMTGALVSNSTALNSMVQSALTQSDNANYIPSYEETELTLPNGHSATIFAWVKGYLIASPRSGKASCFDWTADALCAGFGDSGNGTTKWDTWNYGGVSSTQVGTTGDTNDFGYVADGAGCVWAKGKSGDLWSFDAGNGSVPCRRVSQNVNVTPSEFFCDAVSGHVTAWNNAKLQLPLGSSISDIDELKVTLKDSNDNIITGYNDVDLMTLGTHVVSIGILDLTSLSTSTYPSIKAEFSFKALNGNIWASSTVEPLAVLTFAGDDPQICYQTQVDNACDIITPLTNSGIVTIVDADQKSKSLNLSATTNVLYPDGQGCIPDVRLSTTTSRYKYYPGELIVYDIVSQNIANSDLASTANGIELSSNIPENTTYISSSPEGIYSNSKVTWPDFDLNGTSSTTHSITVQVKPDAIAFSVSHSLATLVGDPTITNNSSTISNEIGTLGSIKAKAFQDVNNDGINNGADIPMNNVEVALLKNGISLETGTTDSNGIAVFANLVPASDYALRYTLPNNYLVSNKNMGNEQDLDSDIDTDTLSTGNFSLEEGQTQESKAAGFHLDPSVTTTTSSTTSTTTTTSPSTQPNTTIPVSETIPTTVQLNTVPLTPTTKIAGYKRGDGTTSVKTTIPVSITATTQYMNGARSERSNTDGNVSQNSNDVKGEAAGFVASEKKVNSNAGTINIPLLGHVKTSTLPFVFIAFIVLIFGAASFAIRRHSRALRNID